MFTWPIGYQVTRPSHYMRGIGQFSSSPDPPRSLALVGPGGSACSAGRRITKNGVPIGSSLPRSFKVVALGVMLVLSALLTTAALRVPDQHWLAWISFLPLFAVVRWLRPSVAVLAGGLWGACLYLFTATAIVAT